MEEIHKQTGKNMSKMDCTERFIMQAAANQEEGPRASNSPSGQIKGQHRLKRRKASSRLKRK